MFCSQCGNQLAEGSASCPRCGAPVAGAASRPAGTPGASGGGPGAAAASRLTGTPGASGGGPGAAAASRLTGTPGARGGGPGAAAQGFSFDAGRLSQADKIAGAATVVLLVSLFLPWFTATVGPFGSGSASGMTAHSYLWIVFVLCLGIIAFLVAGAGFAGMPFRLPVPRDTILLAATGLNLLIVLLAFFARPNGFGLVTISWSFGAFIAFIAAIVACVPLAAPLLRAQGGR
jgi:zinc-ribbon domain